MFRHKNNARTFSHNFRLATFLSFVAGLVNICGVFAWSELTTNVTGHFAYFAKGLMTNEGFRDFYSLLYILSFFAGSFVSSFLNEYFIMKKSKSPHRLSLLLEIMILIIIGLFHSVIVDNRILVMALLFAMGLQNSIVSKISNSAVRTTHLTGLFTDLGIELSQIFFNGATQKKELLKSIELRLTIVAFFFTGCIAGGGLYMSIKLKTLVLGALILVLALIYDKMLLRYYVIKKKVSQMTTTKVLNKGH
jgi:uncharacterized membrane protein YoaK (UPF0700 family)